MGTKINFGTKLADGNFGVLEFSERAQAITRFKITVLFSIISEEKRQRCNFGNGSKVKCAITEH